MLMRDASERHWILAVKVMGLLVFFAASLNALLYASSVAIPVPIADTWFFIQTFVREALENKLGVADFFLQRGAGDHAQPLQKLLLLADLHLADLDFRVETLWGNAMGVLTCGWLAWYVQRDAQGMSQNIKAVLCGCVLFCTGMSLNVDAPYTWYLVSYAWLMLAIAFAYWVVMARIADIKILAASAAVATLLLGLVLDEYAILVFIGLVVAVLIRDGVTKPKAAATLFAGGFIGLFASRMLLRAMMDNPDAANATGSSMQALLGIFSQPQAWKLIVGPLADSVVYRAHLATAFPVHWQTIQIAIAALLFAAHIAFWWRALFSPTRPRDTVFVMAIALMLLFYASIAGIALSRVPIFGMDYVHQPRYITSYKLNIFALALMFLAPIRSSSRTDEKRDSAVSWLPAICAIAIVLLQLPLSKLGWGAAVYIRAYNTNAAQALAAVGRNPLASPGTACPVMLKICGARSDVRQATMRMLREHRLSIFSDRFRDANGLTDLRLQSEAAPATKKMRAQRKGCQIDILDWGPRQVSADEPFNVRADGRSAFWLKIDETSSDFILEFDGRAMYSERNGPDIIIPFPTARFSAVSGNKVRIDAVCGGKKIAGLEAMVD